MSCLDDLFIVPDIEAGGARVSFTAPAGMSAGAWQVLDGKNSVVSGMITSSDQARVEFFAAIPNCKLWNVNHPFLYEIVLDLTIAGKPQSLSTKFGMRSIKVSGCDILINNGKFYARGYVRGREAHDHPDLANLSLTGYYEKNIKAAKSYGFNLIRFHSTVPPDECFEVADRLGIFIHIEARKYYGRYQKERAKMRDENEVIDETEWRETVLRLRNHPSLLVYCIGNEIRHPGINPFIEHIAQVTRELDPTRLFIDTCAHGEFDRTYVDFDVQHMSYFYPFGKDYDMFDNTYNWLIYGSCKNVQLSETGEGEPPEFKITRAIQPQRPVLAHEICHYIAWRDIEALAAKFHKYGAPAPWWLEETKKLAQAKGQTEIYRQLMDASKHFQFMSWKLGIEAARRSDLLTGFHFLQLSDTDRYENSNGLLDCFDDETGVDHREFLKFNGDSALLADLPCRTFCARETLKIPVLISHYSAAGPDEADFVFQLFDTSAGKVLHEGRLRQISISERGLREICSIDLVLPETSSPRVLELKVWLENRDTKIVENDWKIWCFPAPSLSADNKQISCTIDLDEIRLSDHFPNLQPCGSIASPEQLLIVNRFSEELIAHLANGGDALVLYRVPETRDRKQSAVREKYWLPAVWDRFKGVIWDRGNNCGAVIHPHKSFAGFPHNGFSDLQFYSLINDCDKINLDDFPVKVEPVMRGVDRPVRDRYDVHTYKLSELQPEHTMRNFAYAFELKVGKGRLYVTGLNFTGLNRDLPETRTLFGSVLDYITSSDFMPSTAIEPAVLLKYLTDKGAGARPRERKMTQYWQLDDEPLESAKYWKEADEYITGTGRFAGKL